MISPAAQSLRTSANADTDVHRPKAAFFAVREGRNPGIYSTWAECEAQTKGFSGYVFGCS